MTNFDQFLMEAYRPLGVIDVRNKKISKKVNKDDLRIITDSVKKIAISLRAESFDPDDVYDYLASVIKETLSTVNDNIVEY